MATGTNVASKDVAVKQAAAVPAHVMEAFDDFGDDIEVGGALFEIPRLNIMQSTGKKAAKWESKVGEFRDNNGTLIASKTETVKFIVLKLELYWHIKQVTPDFKYMPDGEMYREPYTHQNKNRDWKFTKDGKTWQAYSTLDVYFIRANEDDDSNSEMVMRQIPMVVSLQSKSFRAAMKFWTEIQNMKIQGKPAHSAVFELDRDIEDSFCSAKIKSYRLSTPIEMEAAAYFRNELKTNKVTVHDEAGE